MMDIAERCVTMKKTVKIVKMDGCTIIRMDNQNMIGRKEVKDARDFC
jgi:hypothetical protein